jgi:ribosomal protein S18 acetylase RimI-like enzyme
MTTYEDGKQVLYCYEIHIHPSLQGQGIGRHLMALFEETGRRIGLEKGMLTVFKANSAATRFYERLGYGIDEFSPGPRQLRNGTVKEPDYLILSKGF